MVYIVSIFWLASEQGHKGPTKELRLKMVSENYFWPVFHRDRKIHGQFYKCKEVDLKA